MQQPKLIWLGFATLGLVAIGCTDDGGTMDEVGDDTTGTTTSGDTSGDTSTDESSSSTSSTDTTDTSTDTSATDTSTDTTTDTSGGDFQLIEAAVEAQTTLILTFNEAVGPVDGVDPSDFRISMALTSSYSYMGMQYDYSYYADPNTFFDEYAMPIGMMAIANGPNPDQISLTLAPGFNVDACAQLAGLLAEAPPEYMADGHFFPHYAPGDIPLTSEGGVELAAIGPDWVLEIENYANADGYGWPNLDPQVPIPCM